MDRSPRTAKPAFASPFSGEFADARASCFEQLFVAPLSAGQRFGAAVASFGLASHVRSSIALPPSSTPAAINLCPSPENSTLSYLVGSVSSSWA